MAALTTTALLALGIGGAVSTAANQRQAAKGAQRAGDFEAQVFGLDADIAELQAKDAIARGREAEVRYRAESRQLVGSQRAALAAQGLDVGVGSAVDVQADTSRLGELDALTIRNNAAREAWGFGVQAADLRMRGQLARAGGRTTAASLRNESISTLLTGAVSTYGLYRSTR